jgi:hypothetical protein
MHKALDGTTKQVDYKTNIINRGAFIAPHVRIKPYVTPNGAYGTTYTYIAGYLIANGPQFGSSTDFSNFDSFYSTGDVETKEPAAKRQRA